MNAVVVIHPAYLAKSPFMSVVKRAWAERRTLTAVKMRSGNYLLCMVPVNQADVVEIKDVMGLTDSGT